MIIKVRISPMERWCPYMRSRARHFPQLDYTKMPGVLVEIETESITQAELCDAKMWKATHAAVAAIASVAGEVPQEDYPDTWFCEHMLETD